MAFIVEYCQAVIGEHGGLMLTLFLGGLLGSLTHCAGMCGPFVLAQVGQAPSTGAGGFARVRGVALLPYHLGRITTYMALGGMAAAMSGYIFGFSGQRFVAATLLCAAAILFLLSVLPGRNISLWPPRLNQAVSRFGQFLGNVAKPFFSSSSFPRRFVLGVILGFLPCGLLAAAITAAASTGNPVAAAMGMAAFGAGTVPALFLVGSGGQFAKARWPHHTAIAVRGVMVFNSISLFVIASSMVF